VKLKDPAQSSAGGRASVAEARDVAEAAREQTWEKQSFARELFLGRLRMDLIDPYPQEDAKVRAECEEFLKKLRRILVEEIDAAEIDRTGEIPARVLERLREIGAFGIKIPREHGGLGLDQTSYNRAIERVASHCASTATLLSAHQSIGVPQPLKLFGTEEQKNKWFPRLARGEISAFALTEPDAGSDPANMKTRAVLSEDREHWVLNGEKLWCTNGTIAKVMIVMAQTPGRVVQGKERRQISAFIVEADSPGVEVVHRCRFMGLRGIYNGLLRFKDVRVPRDSLLGEEGQGLKIALVTLNTGRLTLPSCCVGGVKRALEITRRWAKERFQWGVTIGRHDEIAGKLAEMASSLYAMQSIADLGPRLVDRGGQDVRIEAAIAKLFNTELGWKLVNDCFQIKGGRGYETEQSLKARGESPDPVERLLRDFRINTLVEGSTQIMHLFIAREALDPHVLAAGAVLDPKAPTHACLASLIKAVVFYATWYPRLWLSWGRWPRYSEYGPLATHVRFIERMSRRLARSIFYCMMIHRTGLERRQRLLARIVDIGTELVAMSVTCSRARADVRAGLNGEKPLEMADLFCRGSARRVKEWFRNLWSNDDSQSYALAQDVVAGHHAWLEDGIVS